MAQTNYPRSTTVTETEVFSSFNNATNIASTTNQFDAVKGFFLRKTNNDNTVANSLTDTVLQLSEVHGIDPMLLVDQLKDYGLTDIQQAVISLINQTRNNTSILGYNKNKAPNKNVARNISV
jgi:hypothetical protein